MGPTVLLRLADLVESGTGNDVGLELGQVVRRDVGGGIGDEDVTVNEMNNRVSEKGAKYEKGVTTYTVPFKRGNVPLGAKLG